MKIVHAETQNKKLICRARTVNLTVCVFGGCSRNVVIFIFEVRNGYDQNRLLYVYFYRNSTRRNDLYLDVAETELKKPFSQFHNTNSYSKNHVRYQFFFYI